ncbi:hypothetical protein PMAYCL1PPCAC_00812, partial [Pristionchus mayeri]
AGCLLLCDCGNESYSWWHSETCEIANLTVIFKGGPIRRLSNPAKHPKTEYAYIKHLTKHHKTTLVASGIYILCSCGTRIYSGKYQHDEKNII